MTKEESSGERLLKRLRSLAPAQETEVPRGGLARVARLRSFVYGPDSPLPKETSPMETLEAIITDPGARPRRRHYQGVEKQPLSTGRIEILAAVVLPTDIAVWLLSRVEREETTLPSYLKELVLKAYEESKYNA